MCLSGFLVLSSHVQHFSLLQQLHRQDISKCWNCEWSERKRRRYCMRVKTLQRMSVKRGKHVSQEGDGVYLSAVWLSCMDVWRQKCAGVCNRKRCVICCCGWYMFTANDCFDLSPEAMNERAENAQDSAQTMHWLVTVFLLTVGARIKNEISEEIMSVCCCVNEREAKRAWILSIFCLVIWRVRIVKRDILMKAYLLFFHW